MICQQCGTEFVSKRKTAKYCSPKCRKLAFLVSVPVITENAKVTVPEVSVPIEKIAAVETPKYFSEVVGTGICHGCGETVDKFVCICYKCIAKDITHQSLGLDITKCELKGHKLNEINSTPTGGI